MPIRSPVYRNNIVDTLRKIGDDNSDPSSANAIVLSMDVVGSALVRFEGGHNTVEVECARDLDIQPGDRVKLSRIPGGRWAVDRTYNSRVVSGGSASVSAEQSNNMPLVPDALSVFGIGGAVVVSWNPPSSKSPMLYEVEYADDSAGTNAQHIKVSGSSVTIAAAAPKFVRVRAINADWETSGWTAIETAAPIANIEITALAGEAVNARDNCYIDPADGKIYRIDADGAASIRGVAPSAIANGVSGVLRIAGQVTGYSGLTAGQPVYASTTAGGYTQTKPAPASGGSQISVIRMGFADSATSIIVQHSPMEILKRASVANNGTLTIVHPSDAEGRQRECFAYIPQDSDYTADLTSGQTFSASSTFGGNTASQAFDDNAATGWVANGNNPQQLQVTFGSAKIIRRYTLKNGNGGTNQEYDRIPKSWTLEYWDSSAWQVADTQTNISWPASQTTKTYDISGIYSSTQWRINVSENDGPYGSTAICELEMMEGTVREPLVLGRWSGGTRDVAVRFGDEGGIHADTKTTFKNVLGSTQDMIVGVRSW